MKYTVATFQSEFPTEDVCLQHVFKVQYPHKKGWCRVKNRPAYAKGGQQIYPLKGTIFEKSSTPLRSWFYAIYLFSQSKNGVSAKELQRQLGVTYKCAWRIANKIRSLMKQDIGMFNGIVEADETYIGPRRKLGCWKKPHVQVLGMASRKGKVKAVIAPNRREESIVKFVENNLEKGSTLYTDGAPVYNICRGYKRGVVIHSHNEFVKGDVHTNTIEGFWSHLKRPLHGTYAAVSKRHLQSYVDERVFTWNYRTDAFAELLRRISPSSSESMPF